MYFLDWSCSRALGRFSVVYHVEPHLSPERLEIEKGEVIKLKKRVEIYNEIAERIDREGFLDLCPENYKDPDIHYPLYMFTKMTFLGVRDIPLDRILGDNWSNIPMTEYTGYPKPRKLMRLLRCHLELEEKGNPRDKLPPIEVYKIFDEYYTMEGNHRIYTSRLLGLQTIHAEVYECDYEGLLLNSDPIEDDYGCYLRIKDGDKYKTYQISSKQKDGYLMTKKKYLKS